MKSSQSLQLLALVLLLCAYQVICDIPVHCVMHEIVGVWQIELTEPQKGADKHFASCGHGEPDNPLTSWNVGSDNFSVFETFTLQLNSDNTVLLDDELAGTWTMIYDEGMEIVLQDQRLTAFFYYYPIIDKTEYDRNNYIANCSRTTVGWWTDGNTERACIRAQKLSLSENNLIINNDIGSVYENERYPDVRLLTQQRESFITKRMRGSKNEKANIPHDHLERVQQLNLIEKKSWHAAPYDKFKQLSLKEMNKFAGRKASFKMRKQTPYEHDLSDLPMEFSWGQYLGQVREQGDCGSCYIIATIQMLEARLRIKYNQSIALSAQHLLDCNFYNQGCEGGYPYLVGKFAHEFELIPEEFCPPYQAKVGDCRACNASQANRTVKVTNYR